jgi:hypothetical protein
MSALAGGYLVWSSFIAYMDNWPYPFQRVISMPVMIVFDIAAVAMTCAVLFVKRQLVAQLYGGGASASSAAKNAKKKLKAN